MDLPTILSVGLSPFWIKTPIWWIISNHGFAYWIYGVMSILAALFVWKVVPETKGRTLEQMESLWHAPAKKN